MATKSWPSPGSTRSSPPSGGERLLQVLVKAGNLKGKAKVLSYSKAGGGGCMLKLLGDKVFALSIMQNGPIRLPTGYKIELALPRSFIAGHRPPPPTAGTSAPPSGPQSTAAVPDKTVSTGPSQSVATSRPSGASTTSKSAPTSAATGSSKEAAFSSVIFWRLRRAKYCAYITVRPYRRHRRPDVWTGGLRRRGQ